MLARVTRLATRRYVQFATMRIMARAAPQCPALPRAFAQRELLDVAHDAQVLARTVEDVDGERVLDPLARAEVPEFWPGFRTRASPVRWHCSQTLSRSARASRAGLTIFAFDGCRTCFSEAPWQRSQVIASRLSPLEWHNRHSAVTRRLKSGFSSVSYPGARAHSFLLG